MNIWSNAVLQLGNAVMSDQLELMVKYLINLQFYSEEEDVLYSRDKRNKITIPGIGEVIAAFENEFIRM